MRKLLVVAVLAIVMVMALASAALAGPNDFWPRAFSVVVK